MCPTSYQKATPFAPYISRRIGDGTIHLPDGLTIVSNLEACYLCIDSAFVRMSPSPTENNPADFART